ncbi:MAG: VOC family protein [Balneolales bacterium]
MHTHYQPKGYHTVTPYLAVREAEKLIDFLKRIFLAEEYKVMRNDDGTLLHAEIMIGDSIIMIGDVQNTFKPFPGMLYVYVDDVDTVYKKVIESEAEPLEQPADQEYGDRRCAFRDPAGNEWWVATRVQGR